MSVDWDARLVDDASFDAFEPGHLNTFGFVAGMASILVCDDDDESSAVMPLLVAKEVVEDDAICADGRARSREVLISGPGGGTKTPTSWARRAYWAPSLASSSFRAFSAVVSSR